MILDILLCFTQQIGVFLYHIYVYWWFSIQRQPQILLCVKELILFVDHRTTQEAMEWRNLAFFYLAHSGYVSIILDGYSSFFIIKELWCRHIFNWTSKNTLQSNLKSNWKNAFSVLHLIIWYCVTEKSKPYPCIVEKYSAFFSSHIEQCTMKKGLHAMVQTTHECAPSCIICIDASIIYYMPCFVVYL